MVAKGPVDATNSRSTAEGVEGRNGNSVACADLEPTRLVAAATGKAR